MRTLMLLAFLTSITFSSESGSYYNNFCSENPYEPECYSHALGGTDSLEKERAREHHDDYYDLDDSRDSLGQDMEDPRESL